MTGPRVLPIRVAILPGEGLDSWLEALARRNGLTLTALLRVLGVPAPSRIGDLVTGLPAQVIREIATRTATDPRRLDQAVIAAGCPIEHNQRRSCRFCPLCLAETGGRWQLGWWLPWVFACTTHRVLLNDACPGCGGGVRIMLPGRTLHPAGTCTRSIARGQICGADLTGAAALNLEPGHRVLKAQQWIDTLLAQPDHAEIHAVINDLAACSRWLARTIDESDLRGMGAVLTQAWHAGLGLLASPSGRFRPLPAAVQGVVTHAALPFLTADTATAVNALQALRSRRTTANAIPAGMTQAAWSRLSPGTQHRFLRAADRVLRPVDRVRWCSRTPRAATPDPSGLQAARRVRCVPQLLWPGWTVRLMPPEGVNDNLFRGVASALLLLPGEPVLNTRGITDRLHPYLPNAMAGVLRFAVTSGHDDMLTAICNLAHYLDTHASLIDYQRRRELVPAEPITLQAWRALCFHTDSQPGERVIGPNQVPRFVHAQRYLHQLLTGADLADPSHRLGWKNPSDRARYLAFGPSLTRVQRDALHDHGRQVLHELGIDEPLTWEPPSGCVAGLALPGPEPADIDLDAVVRIVFDQQRPPSAAARELGTSLTHIRHALQHAGAPTRDWSAGSSPLTAWRRRQRAAALLTRDFLQQHYVEAAKTFTQIAAEHDLPRELVVEHAEALGITVHRTRRPVPIDNAWLREQYLTHKRSTASIATELGTEDETVRRRLQRLGIQLRPAGVHSRQAMIGHLDRRIPRDVRAAVEGTLHGWLRLHRFQITMAFPSLETAAIYLSTHQGALVRQFRRLERDIGQPLFHRSTCGKPHRPTARGKTLLRHLETGPVTTLMRAALVGREGPPMPDAAILAAAMTAAVTRRPPGPLRPYPDIDVPRIRIRPETLTLLQDLLDHADQDTCAAQVSARTVLSPGSVSPRLRQLEQAGWLTSRPETDTNWRGRAPAGCGPGRRRTYYTLTGQGHRAATHELQTRTLTTPPGSDLAPPLTE